MMHGVDEIVKSQVQETGSLTELHAACTVLRAAQRASCNASACTLHAGTRQAARSKDKFSFSPYKFIHSLAKCYYSRRESRLTRTRLERWKIANSEIECLNAAYLIIKQFLCMPLCKDEVDHFCEKSCIKSAIISCFHQPFFIHNTQCINSTAAATTQLYSTPTTNLLARRKDDN
jgi:hypothetical protein